MDFLDNYFKYDNNLTINGLTNTLAYLYVDRLYQKHQKNIIVLISTLYEANEFFSNLKAINDKKGEFTEETVAFIDCDYSLIRFLSSQLSLKEVTLKGGAEGINLGSDTLKVPAGEGGSATGYYYVVVEYVNVDENQAPTESGKTLAGKIVVA